MNHRHTFVLVHGAWHGGWCYARVAARLRAAGHDVHTPTLTGLADRSHLVGAQVDLSTHITDVVNTIRWEGLERLVLVGHSYGGVVVTGVADRLADRISALIYLDAFLPVSGKSFHELLPPETAQQQRGLATPANGFTVAPIPAAAFNVNEVDREWVDSQCTPQPLATFSEPIHLSGAVEHIAHKTYVLATRNHVPGFRHFYDSVKGKPGWSAYEMTCGHDVMIDLPDETTDLLIAAANTAAEGA